MIRCDHSCLFPFKNMGRHIHSIKYSWMRSTLHASLAWHLHMLAKDSSMSKDMRMAGMPNVNGASLPPGAVKLTG